MREDANRAEFWPDLFIQGILCLGMDYRRVYPLALINANTRLAAARASSPLRVNFKAREIDACEKSVAHWEAQAEAVAGWWELWQLYQE